MFLSLALLLTLTTRCQSSLSNQEHAIVVKIDEEGVIIPYECSVDPAIPALAFCSTQTDDPSCHSLVTTKISQSQARTCDHVMEEWIDRPVRDWLERLQWMILDQSTYHGVTTWKFPFDLWMYREIIYDLRPTVIVEVGNFAGGSALFFADLFDTMGLHPGRIIAVDIDHSNLHSLPKSHPRITWIEEDAVHAFDQVAGLIDPIHDTVMVIEDASHKYQHTLEIMQRYGTLVTNGSYMIIEDTALHNGVRNPMFSDDGAHASVKTFLENNCGWNSRRDLERYVVSWNPTGFLHKIRPEGKCDIDEKSPSLLRHQLQQHHAQWRHASLDQTKRSKENSLYDWERNTPLTIGLDLVPGAVKTMGVAVVPSLIPSPMIKSCRDELLSVSRLPHNLPDLKLLEDLLSTRCLDLFLRNKDVLNILGVIFDGAGVEVENVEIVVQQIGADAIAPSLDERGGPPPLSHPLSVRVVWMMDHYTTCNGAAFYLDGRSRSGVQKVDVDAMQLDETTKYPMMVDGGTLIPQMVTGEAGSVIFFNGGIASGVAPNVGSESARVGLSITFVPDYVRIRTVRRKSVEL